MTTKEVTAISFRLFSLWLLVQVIMNVPSLALLLTGVEQYQGRVVPEYVYVTAIGGFVVIGVVAAYLIWVAARSTLASASSTGGQMLDRNGQKFLLQLGGAYFVVDALAYLPRSLGFLQHSIELSYATLLSPLGLFLQLGIGLTLLVNPSHWTEIFQKLRGRR